MPRLNSRKRKSKRKSRKKRSRKRNQKGGAIEVKIWDKKNLDWRSTTYRKSFNNKKIKNMALETLKEGQNIHGHKVPFKNAEDYIQHFIFKLENYLSEIIKKQYPDDKKFDHKLVFKERKLKGKDGVRAGVALAELWASYQVLKGSIKKKKLSGFEIFTPLAMYVSYMLTKDLYKEFFGKEQNIAKYVAEAWNNDDLHPSSTDKITQKFVKETMFKLTKESREQMEEHIENLKKI